LTQSERIGDYEIVEEIGRDSFAVDYRAQHTSLNRRVILKVLHERWADDLNITIRFRRETRAATRLRHPSIATVYETGEKDGQKYIASEDIGGRSLREMLDEEESLSLARSLPLLQHIAEAVDYAHTQGVIHADLNTDNIYVEETKRGLQTTVTGFGLARILEGCRASSPDEIPPSAPDYLAPEQADPERSAEVGPATDRYAVGAVAYHMLTGRPPFIGTSEDVRRVIAEDAPPTPTSVRSELFESLNREILKMLSKAPDDRFPSCRAFVDRLRQIMLTESQILRIETRLEPLYERLRAAEEQADWPGVVQMGELIQVLDAAYRDVPELIVKARAEIRKTKR
jgi:serine/threonine protein kinase